MSRLEETALDREKRSPRARNQRDAQPVFVRACAEHPLFVLSFPEWFGHQGAYTCTPLVRACNACAVQCWLAILQICMGCAVRHSTANMDTLIVIGRARHIFTALWRPFCLKHSGTAVYYDTAQSSSRSLCWQVVEAGLQGRASEAIRAHRPAAKTRASSAITRKLRFLRGSAAGRCCW